MNGAEGDPPLTAAPREGVLVQVALAASFLTIIPILDGRPRSPEAVANSFKWFPLIGFALGALLMVEDWAGRAVMGPAARAIVAVMTLTVVTGAVHLDGLADTADALSAGGDRLWALEILRDSRIGTFGALAVFFCLILKVSALAGAAARPRSVTLFLAPGLARWAMVMVADRMEYLRREGAGSALLRNDRRDLITASVIAAGGTAVSGTAGLRGAAIAVILALIMRSAYRRWLGGITGDLIGAAAEIVETGVMIALCA
jgi:adenosylcobinamide-GDP ribazoletransferase